MGNDHTTPVQRSGLVTYQAGPGIAGETGILSTVTQQGGSAKTTSRIEPTDLVTYMGVQMTVEGAAREGFLVRDGDTYRDPSSPKR